MQALPETGFLRLRQIIGDSKKNIPALIPVCRTSWWKGIKSGKYPTGHKLGPRCVVWKVEDIRKLISQVAP